jgi:ubiquinone/menaquinone biosynthesis C-methylase UbiE
MTERVHHPIFARAWERISSQSEARGGAEHRRRLLAGLSGEVIELGAGSGANFRHYPSTVTRVLAVEPEQHLRGLAEAAAATSLPLKVEVIEGVSSELPAEDASFDAGVVSLVLCSVPDQGQALSELRRVIRPGGELRFYEHVVSKKRVEARIQRFADATFWPRVAGGCHSSRDTSSAIERAGFEITDCDRFPFSPAPLLPPAPHVLGVARRR